MKYLVTLFLVSFLFSCQQQSQVEKEIESIDITFKVERFDKAFHNSKPSDLPKLMETFPFMFPDEYPDEFWEMRMQDSLQQQLTGESTRIFEDFSKEKDDITRLFQHLEYYFPEFKVPRVITSTSNVDYRNKVIVTDTIVLISVDTYLGKDHDFYQGIQKYLTANFERNQIVVDLATAYSEKYTFQSDRKSLLDEMIYYGKQLYFKDVMIPFVSDAEKIGYTEEQLKWARTNEWFIWNHFIGQELLYDTSAKLPSRFINPAPFSKFYLEQVDNESPGRIGQYMGWQIVKSYMSENPVSLKKMLNTEPLEIFKTSKYKPKDNG
ncbi:gliding motility lipoprotein GldB [Bizionia argentinensis JUB59]|uniref:Gliding motility lipoprotein GldB n=1 Tax=Bizionia argentinensis JUB59 TaxID=1046627 RepID=G2EDI3_9FLAO|nr:gliding motility lipoprotein GldB [Bizionia argentinensis]EGV43457.1 gliding motility lipoprotein GldB [Bizionia argentinensis JUB59]